MWFGKEATIGLLQLTQLRGPPKAFQRLHWSAAVLC
jgi:hypothetical protein